MSNFQQIVRSGEVELLIPETPDDSDEGCRQTSMTTACMKMQTYSVKYMEVYVGHVMTTYDDCEIHDQSSRTCTIGTHTHGSGHIIYDQALFCLRP